jgi:two-component system chemotaxis response regulator CheY
MTEQHFSGKTVMIVDDNEAIYLYLSCLLEEKGFTVVTFGDPLQAANYISTRHVDLIASDYHMPEMDGIRLLTIAKGIHPDIKTLLMTSDPLIVNEARARYRVIEKFAGFFGDAVATICSMFT